MVAEPASPVSNQQPLLRAVQLRQVSCSTMPDKYKQQQKDAGVGNDHEELTLRSARCLSSRSCFSAPAVPVSPHCIMRNPALSKGRSLSATPLPCQRAGTRSERRQALDWPKHVRHTAC